MRVRITARPGELEERAGDVIRAIQRIAGGGCCERLEKASPTDTEPRRLEIPALQGGVDRASRSVERIRAAMMRKILDVIRES